MLFVTIKTRFMVLFHRKGFRKRMLQKPIGISFPQLAEVKDAFGQYQTIEIKNNYNKKLKQLNLIYLTKYKARKRNINNILKNVMKLFFPFQRQAIFEMISDFSYYSNK